MVDREGRIVRVVADGRALSYRFGPLAPAWQPIEIEGNDAAWHDPGSGAVIHVDHACGRDLDVPLPSLVQHLLIGFTEREYLVEETVPFDGREARHVVVRASLDGVPRMLELYVLKKDGCIYDIGVVAPPRTFEQVRSSFETFARGFHTLSTGTPAQASRPEASP